MFIPIKVQNNAIFTRIIKRPILHALEDNSISTSATKLVNVFTVHERERERGYLMSVCDFEFLSHKSFEVNAKVVKFSLHMINYEF